MQRHASIELDWADGTFTFRLGMDELEELERKLDRSVFAIFRDARHTSLRSYEISEVIRIGLLGGGMKPADALAKVRRYCELDWFAANEAAMKVVGAALTPLEKQKAEKPGKPKAPKKNRSASTSGPSTEVPR